MEFRRRRALNWLTLGFTYAAMYMGRYNLSFANKALSDTYGWDKTQIGAIITAALTIYGISALFNGPIADRIGGRKAMLIGVFGSVVFNLAFGLGAYVGFLGTGCSAPLVLRDSLVLQRVLPVVQCAGADQGEFGMVSRTRAGSVLGDLRIDDPERPGVSSLSLAALP